MRIAMAFVFCLLSACSEKEHSVAPVVPLQSVGGTASQQTIASATSQSAPRELSELGKHEPDEITESENLVERKEKTLSFQLLSGKVIELTNIESCENYENCVFYTYRGLIADKQFFLVNADYYEGGSVFVISRKTGEKVDTVDDPHVSPDGKYIVSASEYEAFRDAGVFLWEIVDGTLVSRFHYAPDDYQLFRFISWIDTNNVELIKTTQPPVGLCPKGTPAEYSMKLVANKGTWTLGAVSDNGKCYQNKK
jgi:hypothetical protein